MLQLLRRSLVLMLLAALLTGAPTAHAYNCVQTKLGPEMNGNSPGFELTSEDVVTVAANSSTMTYVSFSSDKPFLVNGVAARKITDTWYRYTPDPLWIGQKGKTYTISKAKGGVWPYLNIAGKNSGKDVTYTTCVE
jgi:hypothetical protein